MSIDPRDALPVHVPHRGALHGFAPSAALSPARRWANRVFPVLAEWWGVFERGGITDDQAVRIAASAERNGTSLPVEAVALGHATEERITLAIADELGIEARLTVDPDSLALPDSQAAALIGSARSTMFVKMNEGAETHVLAATDRLRDLAHHVGSTPHAAERLRLVPVTVLRSALAARVTHLLENIATFDLFTRHPAYSARTVVNAWQGCALGALAIGLPVAVWAWPAFAFAALHIVFTLFFFSCVVLRFMALAKPAPAVGGAAGERPCPADLPIYSVLVALYKEADVVGELIAALRKLDWPASKLDIKLVCEADDNATIAAIRAARPPPYMQVVAVPDFGPRTKPKALNYALQTCRGEFIVLYDAEDKPHPGQLMEAWRRFRSSPPAVACLQAPLEITNGDETWIARLFAFEYSALFRGLLPWLSARQLILPLGGTSNHFRRATLEEVGGWDPYNVTEDADLGARLMRFGYRTETISLPTLEEAPTTRGVWVPQRTRWFKGWLQSWLVHMRAPTALYRELGPKSFLVVQVVFGGMVISALVHPILLATIAIVGADLIQGKSLSTFQSTLLVVDTINIACGYVSFWLLGWHSRAPGERRGMRKIVLCTLFYWMLMSYAAWRSVIHLYRVPHLWEKTPHGATAAAFRPPPAHRTSAEPLSA
ncbi:glycosyltransferase [Arvimicrobium flavum]|uniref:glycosyltransferase n=1 Tax=Arvimicrobium flavum TaxID=3393320 RepID=UPI00237C3C7F|nr:glycosyltransferase [Mesorhizobium shangrilense]